MNNYLDPDNKQAQADEQRLKAQMFERQVQESFAFVISTPEGLLIMRWLVDLSGILKSQYPGDHAQATYIEGKRFIGAKLLNMAAQAGKLPAILEGNNNDN
ncbi:hypothetical protein [uncultured Desulfovibrio sp.]|uniref:hypothetical protein n=1 Tax=uncultured Desulfovibrio sp. TaxID=167968 RepID=UPI00262E4AD1|nr:hypothetical protein [uncultured Desulfovibrio sp.]